ncbi:MAG: ferritin family protein [Anaerohalosphaeraceae bacterium]|nr:ferritin family protein [Anaerohalosphaeraceae bacterium]
MSDTDSIEAILDFAISGEIEAQKFYKDLAAKMDNPTMKQAFLDFAVEEAGHQKKLENLKVGKKVKMSPSENVPDLKISDYLVAVEPTADMDYQSALILAMKKEKKAFQLYTNLAHLMLEEPVRQMLLSLAQEEAKHKLHFELEYDEIIFKED